MRRAAASHFAFTNSQRRLGRNLYDDALPGGCAIARRARGNIAAKRPMERTDSRLRHGFLPSDSNPLIRSGIFNLATERFEKPIDRERGLHVDSAFLRYDSPLCTHEAGKRPHQSSPNEMALPAGLTSLWVIPISYGHTVSIVRTNL